MEGVLINISTLNDFLFCPYSIYLHNTYSGLDEEQFHETAQVAGKMAHSSIDNVTHNTSKDILLGINVYSEKYRLVGKIDQYYQKQKILVERKNLIKTIYDGYILQLYAQYFCLLEMGFEIDFLRFHSLKDNKNYNIELPNYERIKWFENILEQIKNYSPMTSMLNINLQKCKFCVYRPLCDKTEIDFGSKNC